jgi:hypothetical protein
MNYRQICVVGLRVCAILWVALSAGCVTKTRYEEARSASVVEREGRRRSQQELIALQQKFQVLQSTLKEREQRLDESGERVAESDLARDVALGERQSAVELVEQLRMDLERTGNHLRTFAEAKTAAESRAKRLDECEQSAADNAIIVRDTTLALREPIAVGDIELDPIDGRAVLRVPASEISGETLSPVAEHLLQGVAKVASLHPGMRISIAETKSKEAARLRVVADRLAALGVVAERVKLVSNEPGGSGSPSLEVTLYVDNSATSPTPPPSDEPTVDGPPPS